MPDFVNVVTKWERICDYADGWCSDCPLNNEGTINFNCRKVMWDDPEALMQRILGCAEQLKEEE